MEQKVGKRCRGVKIGYISSTLFITHGLVICKECNFGRMGLAVCRKKEDILGPASRLEAIRGHILWRVLDSMRRTPFLGLSLKLPVHSTTEPSQLASPGADDDRQALC